MKSVRELDAGKPHVQFDERWVETDHGEENEAPSTERDGNMLGLSYCTAPPFDSTRGEPLRDYETIVKLISRTATANGLKVTCRLDRRRYPTGRKVTDEEMQSIPLKRHKFHGDWNYTIQPRPSQTR